MLNASGGMEAGMAADYAMQLNRDAQVNVLTAALPLLGPGSRVVFVTSHQAHFIHTTPTMPEYEPVALSKRAGEDALRAMIPTLDAAGIEFIVVSGDMIEGTITATLLERANPGAINAASERGRPAVQRGRVRGGDRRSTLSADPGRITPATSATSAVSPPANAQPHSARAGNWSVSAPQTDQMPALALVLRALIMHIMSSNGSPRPKHRCAS